jgi:hypothetical protein
MKRAVMSSFSSVLAAGSLIARICVTAASDDDDSGNDADDERRR